MSHPIAVTWTLVAPTVFNFGIYLGEDVSITATASPIGSISGWSVSFTVKDYLGGTQQFQKTVGSGVTLFDTTNGVITVTILSANTSSLQPGFYAYDCQRTDSGNKTLLFTGLMQVIPEVTT